VTLPVQEIFLRLINQPGQLSLAISPWEGAMSTGASLATAVMFCGWAVKAGMACVW